MLLQFPYSIIFLYNTVYRNLVFNISAEAFNISDKSIKVKRKFRDLSSWSYARQSKESKKIWGIQIFLFFFSMSGKFLDIYKCHFGEGGRNNIKLYLFLYIVMKLGMFLKGIFLVWTNGYWSFRCGSTWPVAASLGRFEGWGLPTVLLPWATEGKSQAGVGMAKGGQCLQFRQLNSSSSTASDCQQFISRTLPVNIFFLSFFMLMVTTRPIPPILIHRRKIENISASYSVVTNVHSRCCVNFHRTKRGCHVYVITVSCKWPVDAWVQF